MGDFTQADLDRIDNLLKNGAGVQSVTMEDQTLALAPAKDILTLRSFIQRQVITPVTHRFAVTNKGF